MLFSRKKALKSLLCLGLGLFVLPAAWAQTLTIESWRKDDQLYWDKVLIPAFQRQHPGIKVEFTPEEPLSYDSRVEARLATGRAGDLIFCRPFETSQRMHDKSYLTPLGEDVLRPFSAQARRAWSTDDGHTTYCLPVAYVIHGLFYNKALFQQHRLKPPSLQTTFLPCSAGWPRSAKSPLWHSAPPTSGRPPRWSSPAWARLTGMAKWAAPAC